VTGLLLSVSGTYTDIVTSVFSATIAAKAWFATAAIVLAVVQVTTAARIYGRFQRFIPLSGKVVGRIHRWTGRLAFLCTLPVAFHCIFILGFQTTDARVLFHSLLGSFVYGVFAVKMLFVRSRSYPGWLLPVAGGMMFAVLVGLWASSSLWYFTNIRFGF
jgi:hypothetical protein